MGKLKFIESLGGSVPEQAAIYRLRPPGSGRTAIRALLTTLGLLKRLDDDAEVEHQEGWWIVRSGPLVVGFNELSGGFRFRLRPLRDEPRDGFRVTDEDAQAIAWQFLEGAGPREPVRFDRVTHLLLTTSDSETQEATRVLDAGVLFGRQIDEVPVVGPGGFTMVNIGGDALVTGMRQVWRPLGSIEGRRAVIRPEVAIAELKRRITERGLTQDLLVTRARFGYVELGIERAQRFIEPAYVFLLQTERAEYDYKTIETVAATRGPGSGLTTPRVS